ncbi:MAG TPA: hypothetical protein VGM90_25365 [Kofleriaceae bacterium]|jgi:hypothetical protein
MQIVRAVAGVATLLTLAATRADACSLEEGAHASVLSSEEAGFRPWLHVGGLEAKDALSMLVAEKGCTESMWKLCKGTPVVFEQVGSYLRPSADLPAGARVQLVVKEAAGATRVIANFNVRDKHAAALPAWAGATLKSTTWQSSWSMCSSTGPVLTFTVKPTKTDLKGAVVLLYLKKPDPAHPETDLVDVNSLTYVTKQSPLHFDLVVYPLPAKVWIALADDDGHVGPAIEVAPKLSAADRTKADAFAKEDQ